jgi:hypothetical protein
MTDEWDDMEVDELFWADVLWGDDEDRTPDEPEDEDEAKGDA